MATTYANRQTINDGLVFSVDAGNTRSYNPGDAYAADFSGSGSTRLSSSSTDFKVGAVDFSFGGWFYFDSIGANDAIMGRWRNYLETNASYTLWDAGGNFRFSVTSAGNDAGSGVTGPTINNSQWYFVVCVHEYGTPGTIKLSIDGGTFLTNSHSGGAYSSAATDFTINDFDSRGFAFDGKADNCFFYNKALSQSEVIELYNSGNGKSILNISNDLKTDLVSWWSLNEVSGTRFDNYGSNHLTDNGSVTRTTGKVIVATNTKHLKSTNVKDLNPVLLLDSTDTSGMITDCAQFDGVNEYLSSTSADFDKGDEDFSIGGWYYFDTTGNYDTLFMKWVATGDNRSYGLRKNNSEQIEFFLSYDGTSGGSTFLTNSTNTVSANQWHFISGVYDSSADTMSIYIDDYSVFQTTGVTGGAYSASTSDLYLGNGQSADYHGGRMSNCFFYDKALTQAEVTQLYNNGNGLHYGDFDSGLLTNLVSYWTLNEQSGSRIDNHGSNDLTDNNTVTFDTSNIVSYLRSWSYRGITFTQTTTTNQPLKTYNGVEFDTSDTMVESSSFDLGNDFTIFVSHKPNASSLNTILSNRVITGGQWMTLRQNNLEYSASETVKTWTTTANESHIITIVNPGFDIKTKLDGLITNNATNGTYQSVDNIYNWTLGSSNGKLFDIIMFDRVLTNKEINLVENYLNKKNEIYPTLVTTDLSKNFEQGKLINGVNFNSNDKVWEFDGVDGYINFGSSNVGLFTYSTDSFSIEAWVKTTDLGTECIVSRLPTNLVGWELSLNARLIAFNIRNGGANLIQAQTNGYSVTSGEWSHVCVTKAAGLAGSTVTSYINGVLVPTTIINNSLTDATTQGNLLVGAREYSGVTNEFNGSISNVKIYNKALTAQEIKYNYNISKSRFGL
jgi:hypothetical protein